MAQWHSGRLPLWLVTVFSLGLLEWVTPRSEGRRARARRAWASALLLLATLAHLHALRVDALVLVQDGPRTLLLARHQGRGALISTRADAISCRHGQRLASGYGLSRYDWLVLLDGVSAPDPGCWKGLAGVVVAETDGLPPLAPGRALTSPGLIARGLTEDSQALNLTIGHAHWLLLPNPQALWSWRRQNTPAGVSVWLGFSPGPRDRRLLVERGARRVWLSGARPTGTRPFTTGWIHTGTRGHLSGRA
jgi:competence protein ComEC